MFFARVLEEKANRIALEDAQRKLNEASLEDAHEQRLLATISRNAETLQSLEQVRSAFDSELIYIHGVSGTKDGAYQLQYIRKEEAALEKEGITGFNAAVLGNDQEPGKLSVADDYLQGIAFMFHIHFDYKSLADRVPAQIGHKVMRLNDGTLTDDGKRWVMFDAMREGKIAKPGYAFDIRDSQDGKKTKVFVTNDIPNANAVVEAHKAGILILSNDLYPVRVAQFMPRRGNEPRMVSYVDRPQNTKKGK